MMRKQPRNMVNSRKVGALLALLSFMAYMPVGSMPAFADIAPTTLPDLNKAVNGDVSTTGNRMDVSINGGAGTVGQFDWNTFNVGKDAQVNWVFNANSQTALNRVLASGGMSYIYGKLTESSGTGCPACVNTGKVILINPQGIMFGNGSQINLNSFTASTYDIAGAKNLQGLSEEALTKYAGTGGKTGDLFNIAGYNKTVKFVSDGTGNGVITADGATFRKINADGTEAKTYAMVADKINIGIDYGTKIQTQYDSTPNIHGAGGNQTRSNVKLVTGDGVNFYYTSSGNIENSRSSYDNVASKSPSETKSISISNSEITTGNLDIRNGAKGDSGDVTIANNSMIYTKKLLGEKATIGGVEYQPYQTGTDGEITIASVGNVNISDSIVETTNDLDKDTGTSIGAVISNGNLTIKADKDINISNSQVRTADSIYNRLLGTGGTPIKAGEITLSAGNDVNIVQTKKAPAAYEGDTRATGIVAGGDLKISAGNNVKVDGYERIQAKGTKYSGVETEATQNRSLDRTIAVNAKNVDFSNTLVNAKNISVNSDNKIDVTNSSVVGDNIDLLGLNTTIDNSLMQYNNLTFFNPEGTKVNNVTIKNDSTFNDKDNTGLTIATNGNLTLDNTKLSKKSYGSTSSELQKSIDLESTGGKITLQNNTELVVDGGNTTLVANGDVAVNNSTVWTKNGNVEVTSKTGKVTAAGSSSTKTSKIVSEGGNTTIKQAKDINLTGDYTHSFVGSTDRLTLQTDGNIIGGTLKAGAAQIGDKSGIPTLRSDSKDATFTLGSKKGVFNAGNNINISDLKSANGVDLYAKDINLASTTDMTLTNTTTYAKGGNTNIAAAGKLNLDDYTAAEGVKTTLSGDTVKTVNGGVINSAGNKVAINANGAIDIDVKGFSNPTNGIEINADVNTSAGSEPLKGKTVRVNAKDGYLAVSKIKADTLDIYADNILASNTTITSAKDNINGAGGLASSGKDISTKAYIEVRTDGGFNLDASDTYNNANKGMYTGGNYNKTSNTTENLIGGQYDKTVETGRDVVVVNNSEKIGSSTVKGEEIGRTEASRTPSGDPTVSTERVDHVYQDGVEGYEVITTTTQEYDVVDNVTYKTTTTDTYKDTQTTTTTVQTKTTTYQDYQAVTDTREDQHIATLNNSQKDAFVLVYGKNDQKTESGTKVVSTKVNDPQVTVDTKVINAGRDVVTTGSVVEKDTRKDTTVVKKSVFCAYEEDIVPDSQVPQYTGSDVSTWVRIPRHAEGVSNAAPVQNDITDASSAVVAAAARLELDNGDEDEGLE